MKATREQRDQELLDLIARTDLVDDGDLVVDCVVTFSTLSKDGRTGMGQFHLGTQVGRYRLRGLLAEGDDLLRGAR